MSHKIKRDCVAFRELVDLILHIAFVNTILLLRGRMSLMCLKLPSTRLFAQQLQGKNKRNKAPHFWPFLRGTHSPPTNNVVTGLIVGLCEANERRRYKVTPSLIGWAQTYNQPCSTLFQVMPPYCYADFQDTVGGGDVNRLHIVCVPISPELPVLSEETGKHQHRDLV